MVHSADQADGPAAVSLIGYLLWREGERLEKVYGDQSYNGVFAKALVIGALIAPATQFEKASLPESAEGFVSVAKREPLSGQITSVGLSKITSTRYYLR
ncbi:hypothetical protein GCM10028807_18470 [Spirosoma daeguense]